MDESEFRRERIGEWVNLERKCVIKDCNNKGTHKANILVLEEENEILLCDSHYDLVRIDIPMSIKIPVEVSLDVAKKRFRR